MENKIKLSGSFAEASKLFEGKYQRQISQELSPYQRQLLNTALRGFGAFSTQEVAKMSIQERKTIMRKYGRTKAILNEMKIQAMTNTLSCLYNRLFPTAPVTPQVSMLAFPVQDRFFSPAFSLKELGVSRTAIIKRLIAADVLPKDFYLVAA